MEGATIGSKTTAAPEGLLRSALEKIVFFECRVSQLESELGAARDAAGRARADAAKAERRALELEQALAGEKGARTNAERQADELHDRVRRLEAERERLLGGLVDRARLDGAAGSSGAPGPEEGGADLAGFIAELRAEIETLRTFRAEAEAAGFGGAATAAVTAPAPAPVVEVAALVDDAEEPTVEVQEPTVDAPEPAVAAPAGPAPLPDTLSTLATRFERSGRVGLTSRDADHSRDLLATRADRALYDRSMGDLTAPDAGRRVRAVRALEALGSRAAAPVLAAALGREESAEVKVALLAALARFKESFVAELAAHQLSDARPAVRVAALEALAAVAAAAAGERLARALSDESPLVRRRAALLLGLQAGDRAEEALAIALSDADRGVARAAVAALSGRPNARAQEALSRGLEHPDASVRGAAGRALSRISGEPVDADAAPSQRRATSRRIAERLAGMGRDELRAAVLRSAAPAAVRAAPAIPAPTRTATPTATPTPARTATPAPARTATSAPSPASTPTRSFTRPATPLAPRAVASAAVAILASPAAAAPEGPDALEPRVAIEIRAALRGCTAEGLAAALGEPAARIEAALGALLASGTVAQRGSRWFMS